MSIPVELEPEDDLAWMGLERCCFCRERTRYWNTERDVACCVRCAATHTIEQLPTKAEWIAKERALSPTLT